MSEPGAHADQPRKRQTIQIPESDDTGKRRENRGGSQIKMIRLPSHFDAVPGSRGSEGTLFLE